MPDDDSASDDADGRRAWRVSLLGSAILLAAVAGLLIGAVRSMSP
jgi:hypothetical protein